MTDILLSLAWKLPLCVVGLTFGEWGTHRYILHGRWLLRWNATAWIYKQHHIEHHGRGMNAIIPHIHLRLRDYWLALPFLAIGLGRWLVWDQVGGLTSAIALSSVCVGHMILWNALHRAIHGLDTNWVTRMPGFGLFAHHHLGHHVAPKRNFGVVCIWSDWLMGTQRRTIVVSDSE